MRRLPFVTVATILLAGLLPAMSPPAVAAADPPEMVAASGTSVLAVSAGGAYSCAIRDDGTIGCWGYVGFTLPTGTFKAVSSGDHHTCAIRTDDTLACWGPDNRGEASPPVGTFVAVSAGQLHTCAISSDETLACWGLNEFGQASPPAGTFAAVSAGASHTCAIRTDGTLACWGLNGDGQASPPEGTFLAVSAGGNYTCAIQTDGTLACWGRNVYGQATPPSGTFAAVSAGGYHTCAIKPDDTIGCWGYAWPSASLTHLPRWLATPRVALSWEAWGLAPIIWYDVSVRSAKWNGDFGSWSTWRAGLTTTSATFTGSPGRTYCFRVRTLDAGMASVWTDERPQTCTAIPLDDRSLTRSSGWTAVSNSRYYRSTALRTFTYGATLTRTGVVTRRLALMATTCPTCGKVKIYMNSTLLKIVDLYSPTTVNQTLIAVSDSALRMGTLKIKVVSSGKKVNIDAVAIRRKG